MNFGQAFSFVFRDPNWFKKIVIVAVVQLIPIIGQIVGIGFMMEVMRRVIANDPVPLPDFDFGGFLGKGFQGFIVELVYAIPLIIFVLPITIVSSLGATSMDADTYSILVTVVSCICGGLSVIYSIIMGFITPAALGRLAATGSLPAAFKFSEIFGMIRKALVPYLIALLGSIIGYGIIAPIGSIACGIGALLTTVYAFALIGHLYGQAYRQAIPV